MVFLSVSLKSMKKLFVSLLLLLLSGLSAATDAAVDSLPNPVSNNAVAMLKVHGQLLLFSFMGIGAKKTSDAITNTAFTLDAKDGTWTAIRAVPGTVGRIGAVAATANDQLFLFGGYVLDSQGRGMTVPDVGLYEPARDRWYREADLPLPLGDSVAGVYRDRYIYLVSGRSNGDVISNVQIYDADKNRWSQATPIPGSPVFGHAGGMIGDTVVYIDGARNNPSGSPRYVASDECWMGKIDHHDPTKIRWTKLPNHPGAARYRIAAGASEKDQKIYFSGGTDNPYDYNGIGYDGKPSEPSPVTFDFNLHTGKWETIDENTPDPTMDHRGLLVTHEGLVLIGGMEKGQKVTARVVLLSKERKAK